MQKIKFYMDFLSPFTYFAWVNHSRLKAKYSAEFEYLPMMMGTLFTQHDIKGPGLIPAKRLYSLKHCFRYAHMNNIEFNPPKTHPFNPLYILRMATLEASGEQQAKVIDLFWKLIWAQGEVLEDPDYILTKLQSNGIKNGADILERTFERNVKQAIKKNTKEALSHHAFGSPSFIINNELFWGNDSIEQMEYYLQHGDQFDLELFKQRTSDIEL